MSQKQLTKEPRYRPVLTASMILHILSLAKTETPLSQESMSVISVLAPFQAKIENNGIVPAYCLAPPKASTLEGLGETDIDTYGSKEEYWNACYAKYILSPVSCSLKEIEGATEHKYLNNLMTDEEIRLFEEATSIKAAFEANAYPDFK